MNIPEGFVLVPADPIKAIDMGWAYLDAARDAEPGKDWAFSHAGYRAMIAAAPAPVEIACRDDGRCEYAIQSGAEGNGHCPNGKCAMPASAPGTGSDTLDCILGVGGFASFGPLDAQPAAHLTIPGALEWDGDNGTHGADGESRAHGESAQPVAYIDLHSKTMFPSNESVEKYLLPGRVATPLYAHADSAEVSRLRALLECSQGDMRQADQIMARQRVELDNLEQSRRSFFDLSQDLEKRLAERDALLAKCKDWIEAARDGVLYPIANEFQGVVGHNAEGLGQQSVALLDALSASAEPATPAEEDPFSATEAPYVPLSAAEVEAFMSMGDGNKAKPKTCIECDQPYCHGVCVERGDQDYGRDQAAKGGCDE